MRHNLLLTSFILLIILAGGACTRPLVTPTPVESPTAAPSTIPTPSPVGDHIRPPAVAGSWYPADPALLQEMVDGMLARITPVDGAPIALIVPHAGYAYSGEVAATGFRQMENGAYEVAVIIASDHQPPLSNPISVWDTGGFETPLGIVPVDVELAQALINADPHITADPAAHTDEHPIEIELPFLQRTCPHCRLVPVLMGSDEPETIHALAQALLSVLPARRAIVIASSDLSHYPSYEDARQVDGATLAAIETGDPDTVHTTIQGLMQSGRPNLVTCACGEAPIRVVMEVARGLGADTITVLRYANSGDTGGDREQVVGYGAVMFWHYEPPTFTPDQQEALLTLARAAIAAYLESGEIPTYTTDDPVLARRAGAFVTLKMNGELRGCIGHTWADQPLYRVVQRMAVAAATGDPRFPSLTPAELANTTTELSVLSPFRRLTDVEQIEVGQHGLMIFQGGQQGLLLPQVPVEEGWTREEYLENLCRKAGLPPGCWQAEAALYAFTAVVFGE